MAGDRAELQKEVEGLIEELQPQYERDRSRLSAEGKRFDGISWLFGQPLNTKYPGGPAYPALPGRTTLLNCTFGISMQDWAATGVGAGIFYLMGHQFVGKVAHGMSGHRFGLLLALPAVVLGWSNGAHRAYLRHLGYLSNGNESFYPGYKDDAAPYFVKHNVSDRRVDVAPPTTASLQ